MNAKKQKVEKVTKPYLTGDIVDRTTLGGALKFFIGTVVMCIAYLILCVVMSFDASWLNIVINLGIVGGVLMIFLPPWTAGIFLMICGVGGMIGNAAANRKK